MFFGCHPETRQTTQKEAAVSPPESLNDVRQSVHDFLIAWLVKRDATKALQSFSKDAFSDQVMLNESCSGYISEANRTSPSAVQSAVRMFLADTPRKRTPKNLDDALDPSRITVLPGRMVGKVANDVNVDRFLLVPSEHVDIASLTERPQSAEFLRQHLGSRPFYVSIVPLGKGLGYFMWIKEGGTWKIMHAGLVCM
jgi:hypothetical protein